MRFEKIRERSHFGLKIKKCSLSFENNLRLALFATALVMEVSAHGPTAPHVNARVESTDRTTTLEVKMT